MTREMGKVIAEARGDVQEGIDIAFLMAGEGRRMFGDTTPSELPDKWAMSIRQPIGIAGIITPWNFPMAIPCWKMMPALVAGNTVVFKPSSDTPHCATLLVELMAEAGFPAGTVNLVTGAGAEVGDAIVDNPDVAGHLVHRLVGDRQADRRAGRRAGSSALSLELGGKNAIVVMADADLDLATDGILWSAFGTTGQRCTARQPGRRRAGGRRAAPRAARDAGARRSASAPASTTRSTSGRSSTPARVDKVGALHRDRPSARASSSSAVRRRRDGDLAQRPLLRADDLPRRRADGPDRPGGDLRAGPVGHPGRRLRGGDDGAQPDPLRPQLVDLHAATRTPPSGRCATSRPGIVYVNAGTTGAETHLPFGGWKETGNGHREAGHAALDTFTEWKSIYVDFSGRLQRAQIDNQA